MTQLSIFDQPMQADWFSVHFKMPEPMNEIIIRFWDGVEKYGRYRKIGDEWQIRETPVSELSYTTKRVIAWKPVPYLYFDFVTMTVTDLNTGEKTTLN